MKKALLLLGLMLLPLAIHAAGEIEIDGIYYKYNNKTKSYEVTSNPNKYVGDIIIPSMITYEEVDYKITRIGAGAFQDCTDLTSITIPNSVTYFGSSSFEDCSNLKLVVFNSNTDIRFNDVFGSQVEKYILGEEVTSIGQRAFSGCSDLISIEIPNTADGSKGSYAVGYFVHGVICKHAAHRESRQIHTSAVDVVLVNHLVDDSQHEVDVAIAVQVPTLTDTLGKHGDELGCIGHRLDVEHVHLVGGVLVHTVARYEQRSLFAQVLGYVYLILSFGASHFDFLLCSRWQQEVEGHQHRCK